VALKTRIRGLVHRTLLRQLLAWRNLPWLLALLAMLLCAPAIDLGWQIDDHFHRAAMVRQDIEFLARSPIGLFDFIRGTEKVREWIAEGYCPWFTDPDLSIGFFRPLSSLTHWFDYRLWPDDPRLMHFHSLLWLAAVVLAAAWFYRRIIPTPWVAGLAALLMAVEDAHAMAAVWLANRNALIGLFFGVLALIAHHRWCRDGWKMGAWLAPAAFLLALLANEGALAIGGYLLAHALFLERGPWLGRLGALVPCGVVGLSWAMTYKALGYGVTGSGTYVDPVASPLTFLGEAISRGPILLFGQLGFPADIAYLMPETLGRRVWIIALAVLLLALLFLLPLLRRERLARFFFTGMLIAVIPVCSTTASTRLLHFVGIGGLGLLALFLSGVLGRERWLPRNRWFAWPARGAVALLIVIHLLMAPLSLALTADSVRRVGDRLGVREAASMNSLGREVQDRVLVMVNAPTVAVTSYGWLIHVLDGGVRPRGSHLLGSTTHPLVIERTDVRTLVLSAAGGFLAPPGSPVPGEDPPPPVDLRNMYRMFDRIYRSDRPFAIGQRIELADLEVEIVSVTSDGRPGIVSFRFNRDLDDPLYCWVRWEDHDFVPFTPPPVGERVHLPAVPAPDPWS